MKKKIQVNLTDETHGLLENMLTEANSDFENGSINISDVVNEIIRAAKLDIKTLQSRHTNIRKSLRLLASQKEMDIESAIKALMELKSKSGKKALRNQMNMEGVE